jgi:hypothetical protein
MFFIALVIGLLRDGENPTDAIDECSRLQCQAGALPFHYIG